MYKSRLCTSLILITLSITTLKGAYATDKESYTGDVEAGRIVSTRCAMCHGPDGEGNGAPKSKISGMDEKKFVKMIHDFQSGARKNVMMQRFTEMLTEKDIIDAAAYYATR